MSAMAAREKRRKVGLTRMDAAMDAMGQLGFSRDIVKNCVRELLKVYGEEGWVAIEEGGYKILIDYILDAQEQPEGEPAEQQPNEEFKQSHEHGSSVPEKHDNKVCKEQNGMHDIGKSKISDKEICEPDKYQKENFAAKSFERKCQEENSEVTICTREKCQMENSEVKNCSLPKADIPHGKLGLQVAVAPCSLKSIAHTRTSRKRQPCYGWISDDDSDDEDESDVVYSSPAKLHKS